MITRVYPAKSNTIASGEYKKFNSGQNSVTELWYGGGGTDTAPEKRNSISRFLAYFDLEDIQSKVDNNEIMLNRINSVKLKMTSSTPRNKALETEFEYDRLNKNIATSYDLICYPLNKDWDEGRGYDLLKEDFLLKQFGNPLISGYSNWESATSIEAWDEPGVYTNPTASTSFFASQHFDLGNEDINMDVTSLVIDWLTGLSANTGIGVAFRRDYELLSTDTRYIASFFTEKTNTAFKPFLEFDYDQYIDDDRGNVTNNRVSRLFLYTFSGSSPANYFSAGTVSIKNSSGVDVASGLTPTQLQQGVYYIDVWMSGATQGQIYKDHWSDVTFDPGYDKQTFIRNFSIKENYYLNTMPKINNYVLTVYGIDNGVTIDTTQIMRVFCDLRVNYTTNSPTTDFELQYRMVMNNEVNVIDWSPVNKAYLDVCQTNFFDLDSSWLLSNQGYELQFRIKEYGTVRTMPETVKFRVLRKV